MRFLILLILFIILFVALHLDLLRTVAIGTLEMASTPASGGPDYSSFTESVEIPFSNDESIEGSTPAIDILVDGKVVSREKNPDNKGVGLDTGSTAFVISDNLVDNFPKSPKEQGLKGGKIEYSTSGTQWEGYWFTITIVFDDKKGNTATAQVEALVVPFARFSTVHYMGIGFGKDDYEPEKNAVLTITHFNDKAIDSTNFRHGYVMRKRSIIIGLTAQNTVSFQCTKLSSALVNQKWFWDEPPVALCLNDNGNWMHGSALIDTGVPAMGLWLVDKAEVDVGTKVTMKFPDENSSFPEYSFLYPRKDEKHKAPGVPSGITTIPSKKAPKIWVNTGQNFYAVFDTLFDADGGYWGLRKAM